MPMSEHDEQGILARSQWHWPWCEEAIDHVEEQVAQARWSAAKLTWSAHGGAKTLEDGWPILCDDADGKFQPGAFRKRLKCLP